MASKLLGHTDDKNMSKRLTVFLSSTRDLAEERSAIRAVIGNLGLECNSMELFGADPRPPLDRCLTEVRASDLVVVVSGSNYGTIVPGTSVSYTEAEYNETLARGKPCLIYMPNVDPTCPQPEESAAEKAFKQRLLKHTVGYYKDPCHLAVIVERDIERLRNKLDQDQFRQLDEPRQEIEERKRLYEHFLSLFDTIYHNALENIAWDATGRSPVGLSPRRLFSDETHNVESAYSEIMSCGSENVRETAKEIFQAIFAFKILALAERLGEKKHGELELINKRKEKFQELYKQYTYESKPRFRAAIRAEYRSQVDERKSYPDLVEDAESEEVKEGLSDILSSEKSIREHLDNLKKNQKSFRRMMDAATNLLAAFRRSNHALGRRCEYLNVNRQPETEEIHRQLEFLGAHRQIETEVGTVYLNFGKDLAKITKRMKGVHLKIMQSHAGVAVAASDLPALRGESLREILQGFISGSKKHEEQLEETLKSFREVRGAVIISRRSKSSRKFNEGRRVFLSSTKEFIRKVESMVKDARKHGRVIVELLEIV